MCRMSEKPVALAVAESLHFLRKKLSNDMNGAVGNGNENEEWAEAGDPGRHCAEFRQLVAAVLGSSVTQRTQISVIKGKR